MLRTKTFVLCMLALFLCSAAAMAGEEQGAEDGKVTLHGLVADGAVAAAKGVAIGAEATAKASAVAAEATAKASVMAAEAVAGASVDTANAVADAAKWICHQDPLDYAQLTKKGSIVAGKAAAKGGMVAGKQAAKTPGRAWRAFKWGLGHL